MDARTGEVVELDAAPAGPERVDAVVRAAAGIAPALSAAGIPGRARLLRAISDAITEDEEPITAAADRETALGPVRVHSELARTAYQLRLFAEVLEDGAFLEVTIDHPDPDAIPAPRPDLRRMMLPIGPVGVFSASNFPLAFSVAGGDTASALAAGCPVVVKAHSGHPQTSELTAAAVRRAATAAGLPADVLTVIHGRQAGRDLVTHPLLKAVGFTGSLAGGRALYDLACARPDPIPFYGELGSINPLVVTPAAAAERAERIAGGLAGSFTLGLGQFCTKPGLAFIPAGPDGQRLTAAVVEAAAQVTPGAMLTPSIREGYASGSAQRVNIPGVRAPLVSSPDASAPDASSPGGSSPGALAGPQVLSLPVGELTDLFYEECFGPLLVLVEYSTVDELVAALTRVPGTLTATIHCGSEEDGPVSVAARAAGVLRERAGRLVWNGYPTGVAVTWAMQHGGPYPSSTFAAHTSVGTAAIRRFVRPVTYQDTPPALLPPELQEDNPLRLPRRVNGVYQTP